MLDLTIPTRAVFLAGAVTSAALIGAAMLTGKRLRTMQPPEVKPRPFQWIEDRDARNAKIAGRIAPDAGVEYHGRLAGLQAEHDREQAQAPNGGTW
jgi:hypothetical protein